MNNFHFIVTLGDIIGVFLLVVIAPLLFLFAVFDVYVRKPLRKRSEERRRGIRR